jgi:hypothetical protein
VRVLLVPLLAAGFAFGLATAATELTKGPAPVAASPTSIVWSGRVFSSRGELTVWLRARGVTYEQWAALHPTASSILSTKSRKMASSQSDGAAGAPTVPSESTSRTMAIVALAASVLGILTLLVASRARLAQRAWRRRVRVEKRPRGSRLASEAVKPPFPAKRVARTAGTLLATKSRLAIGTSAPLVALGPRLRRGLRAGLPLLLAGQRERNTVDAEAAERDSILAREALRQFAPDLWLYVASGLLACVVGITIALYLK